MLSCDQFLAELGNYIENDVAADVRRQLQGHLAHCKTCQVLYDSTEKTLKIVTESNSFDLSERLHEPLIKKVMARIRSEEIS